MDNMFWFTPTALSLFYSSAVSGLAGAPAIRVNNSTFDTCASLVETAGGLSIYGGSASTSQMPWASVTGGTLSTFGMYWNQAAAQNAFINAQFRNSGRLKHL